jgi:DEAD/DEAH box helicase domain-containing protein
MTVVFGFFKVRCVQSLNMSISIYQQLLPRNNKILDVVDLDTQPYERETTGMWIDVPKAVLEFMVSKGINPAEAIHAAEHAFLNCFPMSRDVKTECKAPEKEYKTTESQRKRPAR